MITPSGADDLRPILPYSTQEDIAVKSFNRLQIELDFADAPAPAAPSYLRISARTLGLMNLPEFCPGCF